VAAPVNEIAPAAPVESVAAPEAVVVETPIIMTKMTEFSAKLQQLVGLFSTMKSDFKTLEKAMAREMKIAAKAASKKRRNSGNRKPSGFVKPTRISDELANFLGKEIGTEMARTDVSKEINAYIQAHSLQDKKNGRIIHPDSKLTKLLKVAKEDELTYFNLQRYMKHHFQKASDLANGININA
jgi:chromatin remodeling complex protein RSC6